MTSKETKITIEIINNDPKHGWLDLQVQVLKELKDVLGWTFEDLVRANDSIIEECNPVCFLANKFENEDK